VAARVLTLGTFDLFHLGHVNLLKECAKLGRVTVAVNTDGFIERFKGRPPIMSLPERIAVLNACMWVDDVLANRGGPDSKPVIAQVKPRYIVYARSREWTHEKYLEQLDVTEEWLNERGVTLLYVPYTSSISTTEVIRRCRAFGS